VRHSCPKTRVRLACVKHAASVRSEPGSNSHVQSQQTRHPQEHRLSDSRPVVTGPGPALKPRPNQGPPNAHARCHPAPCLAAQDKAAPRCATDSPCRRPRIPSFTNNVNQQPRYPAPSRITPPGDPPPREDAYMAPPPIPSTPFPKNLNHPLPHPKTHNHNNPNNRNSSSNHTGSPIPAMSSASSPPAARSSGGASADDK
jgi:hypothetical protein